MVDLDIQILRKAEHPIKLLLCVNLPLETKDFKQAQEYGSAVLDRSTKI